MKMRIVVVKCALHLSEYDGATRLKFFPVFLEYPVVQRSQHLSCTKETSVVIDRHGNACIAVATHRNAMLLRHHDRESRHDFR